MTPGRWQWRTLAGLCLALLLVCLPWQAGQAYLLPKERQALDLPYEVNDPDASYFDVAGRMQLLTGTEDPMLRQLGNTLQMGQSCRSLKAQPVLDGTVRSEEHTSELQSLMRISYAVFCLKKQN